MNPDLDVYVVIYHLTSPVSFVRHNWPLVSHATASGLRCLYLFLIEVVALVVLPPELMLTASSKNLLDPVLYCHYIAMYVVCLSATTATDSRSNC